jgi:Arc/MetJ-type ribon-helix-helix transcriptional regulator
MVKKKITITLDEDLLKFLEKKTKEKEFSSISHGIQRSVLRLKQESEKKSKP